MPKKISAKKIKLVREFREFLTEYKVLTLAIAFMIGGATTKLVQSLVNDIIMPIITPFVPAGGWESATFAIGSIVIRWGSFISALLNFIILALTVFLVAKFILRKEEIKKI